MEQLKNNKILCISFNQDQGCFAVGTESGFSIYNSDPFQEAFSRDLQGGIGLIEMLYRTNFLALVGGGTNPKYPPNKVMLWDDNKVKCIGEMSFKDKVQAVKLRQNKLVVILNNKIFVYNFNDLKLVDHIETIANPKGLCSLNSTGEVRILCCPDKERGHVNIILYQEKRSTTIKAHQSNLSMLELNSNGDKLATSSEKGTIIRIYNTQNGNLIQEFRRGSEYALIYNLTFDSTGRWLVCSSDSGTIHIFALDIKEQLETYDEQDQMEISNQCKNQRSKFSFMKAFVPYFNSEWSFAQYRIADNQMKVAFGNQRNQIVVATYDGNFYSAIFDGVNGGDCHKNFSAQLFPQINTQNKNINDDIN